MFTKEIKGALTEYTAVGNHVISKIVFNQEYGLNILTIKSNGSAMKNWLDLKPFDQGVLGSIVLRSDSICVSTNKVMPDKLSSLFDAIEKYEPEFQTVKSELSAMVQAANVPYYLQSQREQTTPKEPKIFPNVLAQPTRATVGKNAVYQADVESMFQKQLRYDFDGKTLKDLIFWGETIHRDTYRTTMSNYSMLRCYESERVIRTTMTDPSSKVAYIEYRLIPERDYGDKDNYAYATKPKEERWLIGFNSEASCTDFLTTTRNQTGISLRRETSFLGNRSEDPPIFNIECSINRMLSFLIESAALPKEAVEAQCMQVEKFTGPLNPVNALRPR